LSPINWVLSCMFVHFKWRLFTIYLGVSSPSKWRDSLFHKHLLISSLLCFCFLFLTPFFHTFIHLIWLSLPSYASFHIFYFRTFIVIITILVFFLYPLEVHLHTYLSTWLSLCSVQILFGFIPLIANLKTQKERVTHKMYNPIINSHHVEFRAWLSSA